MKTKAFSLALALCAVGCIYPAERGKMMEQRVEQLEADKATMTAAIIAQREELNAQLPAIREALDHVENLSRRANADTGVQVDELQELIAMLRGQLEEQTNKIAQLEAALGDVRMVSESQAAMLVQQQQALAQAEAEKTAAEAQKASIKKAEAQTAKAGEELTSAAPNAKATASTKSQEAKEAVANANAKETKVEPKVVAEPEKPIDKSNPKAFADAVVEKLNVSPEEGRALGNEFLKKFRKHEQSARIHYALGVSLLDAKDYRAALAEFGVFIQPDTPRVFTDSKWAPKSVLKSADCFSALKMNNEATMALEEVVAGYPRSPEAKTAQARLDEQKKAKGAPAKPATAAKKSVAKKDDKKNKKK